VVSVALQGTIKVPVVGQVKKTWAAAGLGILGIILSVAYIRHAKAKTAAAAPAGTGIQGGLNYAANDPYPPDGTTGDPTDPNSIDPASGITYGDEQAGYGATAYGLGGLGGGTPGGGYVPPGGSAGGPPFSTNAAWMQAAESWLVDNLGSSPSVVAAALGKYLAGAQVTAAQETIINEANGAMGMPPVAGKDGHPPGIRVVADRDHGGPGGGGGGGGKVKVPNVIGKPHEQAEDIIRQAGLVPHAPAGNRVSWNVGSEHPRAGTQVSKGSTVVLAPPAARKV
jgi:hypothetical protein